MESMRILQEFYCGECSHYIRIPLKINWDRTVNINCPICSHQHRRYINKGIIYENGRYENGEIKEDICPPKSAASKEPITKVMMEAKSNWSAKRNGVIVENIMTESQKMKVFWKSFEKAYTKQIMAELWADKAWREKYGDKD